MKWSREAGSTITNPQIRCRRLRERAGQHLEQASAGS